MKFIHVHVADQPAEPKLLDVLASEARTALTDPGAVGLPHYRYNDYDSNKSVAYAVDRLDEIINALNPSSELRTDYAHSLTVLGRQLAERADAIEQNELSYEEHDPETRKAYEDAHSSLSKALDLVDEAIAALTPA